MAGKEIQHLQGLEIEFLTHAITKGLITRGDVPQGISIGLDSMGPVRDPKTDALFPGMRKALYVFRDTLQRYDLTLVVATNGPDKEGVDILEAVQPNHTDPIRAYAVTEGGGRLIVPLKDGLTLDYRTLAHPDEVRSLEDIVQTASKRSRIMEVLLADKESDGRDAPIRTPYLTNIVLTLPNLLHTLRIRFMENEIDLYKAMPGISQQNYLDQMLGYTTSQLRNAICELKLEKDFSQLTKKQNRRHYVTPRHLLEEFKHMELSKADGVGFASILLSDEFPEVYRRYNLIDSIYIADKAMDVTGEGQNIIGVSEKSMIVGSTYFVGDPPTGMKIVKEYDSSKRGPRSKRIHIADIGTRMTVNITMDDAQPSISEVEGIRILNIGSGAKALEALTYLYDRLYS